jgi:glycosyltransferase involved in cell wall biosynthesis
MLVAHPGADLYGSDRVLLESVAGMVSQGWRVVVTVPGPGPLLAELTARGAEVALCPAPVLRKSALRPREFLRFVREVVTSLWPCARLISRSRADGIYVNTITIPTWLVLGRLMGRRVTCHVHEAEGSASALVRRLIALPLVFASRLIVNSQFSLEVLAGAVPLLRGRATVVYNGIPGPTERALARPELTTPLSLLFVGRLSPRKGPQVAVAAVQELRSRGASVRLDLLGAVFPGYEWFETQLKEQVNRLGLNDCVTFLGFQPDVWPHIAAADVVVVPSVVDEPFGNTAVEAILGARPLVVSATSGLKEASAGYRSVQAVEPDRYDLLATAAEHVVGQWDTFRSAAWEDSGLAHDRHSVERYQREVIRLLQT